MNKFKVFISNIFIYGFGGIISKIVPFIMLPIVTRIMPDASYYGLNDLSTTLLSVGQAIAVFGMYDAMFRLFFDKEDEQYQKQICSTALSFALMTSVAVFIVLMVLNNVLAIRIFGDIKYTYLVIIAAFSVLVGATNSIVAAPTKIKNESKVFIVVNTLSPIISYSFAIPLLLRGYYTTALQIAHLVAMLMIELYFIYRNKKWFSRKYINLSLLKPLIKIAIPLVPSFLIYWIYNSADRLMIQYFLGAHDVGIYAIGSKLGQMSNLIYTAFTGGWLYFAYSTMNEEKQVENNSRIFEYLGIVSYVFAVLVAGFSYYIFKIIFTEEYLIAYTVAPYLFLSPLLLMLFQVSANQFIVMKKTLPNVLILSVGAIINVILNMILIPFIGIEGAAISTLAGYIIADLICVIVLTMIGKMDVSGRFIFCSSVVMAFIALWGTLFKNDAVLSVLASLTVSIVLCIIYKKDIEDFFLMFKNMISNKNNSKETKNAGD